jgi:hypothetical protein
MIHADSLMMVWLSDSNPVDGLAQAIANMSNMSVAVLLFSPTANAWDELFRRDVVAVSSRVGFSHFPAHFANCR